MDYKAVKEKWDSWISKNLANLQGDFRNKSFLNFYVAYNNGFCLKKKLDQYTRKYGLIVLLLKPSFFCKSGNN